MTIALRASVRQVGWLLTGRGDRVGWGPGVLPAIRERRGRRLRRPLRVTLVEYDHGGTLFGRAHAYWINRRSEVAVARVNAAPEQTDVAWVFCQDPLSPAARAFVAQWLARLPDGVPVVNPLASYDAYHRPDAFDRLRAAGVGVPRTRFEAADIGRTRVVHKPVGRHGAPKMLERWTGAPRPGHRAFELVDGRGRDGRWWRYRAYHLLGAVIPGDVVASDGWEARARTMACWAPAYELSADEVAQVRRVGSTLGLDWFAVDHLRRAGDGAMVVVDVNVYPTVVLAESIARRHGDLGQWHMFDVATRYALAGEAPRPAETAWRQFDAALRATADRR